MILVAKVVDISPLSAKNALSRKNSADFVQNSKKLHQQHPPFHAVIREYALKNQIDYRLVYALIRQESRFESDAVSHRGATGLMQIMPVANVSHASDADELTTDSASASTEVEEVPLDLMVPEANVKAGVAYLASLMDLFEGYPADDQIRLALAAYNAGPSRIYDAQEIAAYMGDNPRTWNSVRNALPLLSKRCYSLHKLVWGEGHPRNGNFGDSRQTIQYVENVMAYYEGYKQMYQ